MNEDALLTLLEKKVMKLQEGRTDVTPLPEEDAQSPKSRAANLLNAINELEKRESLLLDSPIGTSNYKDATSKEAKDALLYGEMEKAVEQLERKMQERGKTDPSLPPPERGGTSQTPAKEEPLPSKIPEGQMAEIIEVTEIPQVAAKVAAARTSAKGEPLSLGARQLENPRYHFDSTPAGARAAADQDAQISRGPP